ncbi:MAG: gamma-glutamyltransferase, partial [Alphaproteobacteria bacterium]|nr:gamma-glutamyltransferase [Alphaproteobacteria bacterium]
VYLTVVDGDRNAVSLIASVFDSFGSGLVAPGSGIWFQNRARSFRIDDPGHPNAYGPGKRPMHTIIPAMLTKGDDVQMAFGVMGADYQPQGQVHVLTAMLDFGLDIQAALDQPRFHASPKTGGVQAEAGLSPLLRQGLLDRGHRLEIPEKPIGGGQGIWLHQDSGFLSAGSDPRKDGQAAGL